MEEKKNEKQNTNESQLSEVISVNIICRICANQSDKLIGIYSEDGMSNELANKMNLYLPVKVSENDELPQQCCWQCASTVLAWHDLVITSVEAERRLRSYQFITEKQLEELQYKSDVGVVDELKKKKSEIIENEEEPDVRSEITENYHSECSEEEVEEQDKKVNSSFRKKENVCNLCSITFNNKLQLKRHIKDVHQIVEPKIRRKKCDILTQFACPVCFRGFTRKFDMERHMLKQHPEQDIGFVENRSKNIEILQKCTSHVNSEGKIYKCDYCDKSFNRSYALIRHRTIHTQEYLNCCHHCGKRFRLSSSLARHVNDIHRQIKKFSCDHCGKKFNSKTNRDEHMNIHTNTRPFVCDVCGKSFRQNASLYVHKLFHSDVLPFGCGWCEKKFRRKRDLKVHEWLHTGKKPFECSVCGAAFRLSQDLKRHGRTHSQWSCKVCGLRFSQERYLTMHWKIHASGEEEDEEKV